VQNPAGEEIVCPMCDGTGILVIDGGDIGTGYSAWPLQGMDID
jgi:hypothetical protein